MMSNAFQFKNHIDHKYKRNLSQARANEICKKVDPKKIWSEGSAPFQALRRSDRTGRSTNYFALESGFMGEQRRER